MSPLQLNFGSAASKKVMKAYEYYQNSHSRPEDRNMIIVNEQGVNTGRDPSDTNKDSGKDFTLSNIPKAGDSEVRDRLNEILRAASSQNLN